ncbi:MAG TPA: glycosyltransferase family 2 protein [Chryseolinea sp.]|nr:glycosyltransferase family 2 protein [Chryseolinea sp.]
MTRVSVCIATFNGEKHIVEQLDSILSQLEADSEVIVSDDSSTDKTIELIKSLPDKRITIHPNQKFRSPIFNFEHALKQAKGDYIFMADQDDIWLPGRLNTMMPFFDKYDLIVSDCKVVNEMQETLMESYFAYVRAKPGLFRTLTRTSPYIGCCMAFNRKLLEKALPFPRSILMHDFWIAVLAECAFKIKFIYKPLVLYRRHASAFSATASESPNPLYRKMLFRLKTVIPLFFRLVRR